MFHREALIKKYGSWVRVQVAFYDFLFTEASKLCVTHLKGKWLNEWADGKDFYEVSIKQIEKKFKSFPKAWQAFLKDNGVKE